MLDVNVNDLAAVMAVNEAGKAAVEFENERRTLFTRSGKPAHGPEEMEERAAAQMERFRSKTESALETLTRLENEALDAVGKELGADPLSGLTADEVGRFSARYPLVLSDLRTMDLKALKLRLGAVNSHLDALIYHRAANEAMEALASTAPRETLDGLKPSGLASEADGRRRAIIRAALPQLEALAYPGRAARIEAHQGRAAKIRNSKREIERRRAKLDGSDAQARAEQLKWSKSLF